MARKLALLALLAFAIASCGSSKAPEKPPTQTHAVQQRASDFVGVYADDTYYGDAAYRREAFKAQRAAGVQLVRQPFAWADFARDPARFDDFVGAAADAGIRILPVLLGPEPDAPTATGGMPPPDPARFAGYATTMVERYGPNGSFWKQHPQVHKQPITSWQVWNEPNIPAFWAPKPDAAAYTELLRTTAAAIRKADPHAEVVAAGLPTSHLGMAAPEFLDAVYRAGGKGSFDTVAVHPYAADPAAVVAHVEAIRKVVKDNGDDAKIWVTEFGWGTGGKAGPLTVTPARQADYVKQTLEKLAADRATLGVRGAVVFQWRDPKPFPGRREIWPYYAGLHDAGGAPKPSLDALKTAAAAVAK